MQSTIGARSSFSYDEEEALSLYLKEIGKHRLLSREEEEALARRVKKGDNEALNRLVEGNLRFVVAVSRQYANRGVPLMDLIGEGNLGLLEAAKRFDDTRGCKFISYAVWWIRLAILRALAHQGRIVKLPRHRQRAMTKVRRISSRLTAELGREPTLDEIAEKADLPKRDLKDAYESLSLGQIAASSSSEDEDGVSPLSMIPDTDRPAPDEMVGFRLARQEIQEALAGLPERDREILTLHFGLAGNEPMTLTEIAKQKGLSRERIRQIKERSLGRLRGGIHGAKLLDHYE